MLIQEGKIKKSERQLYLSYEESNKSKLGKEAHGQIINEGQQGRSL